MRLAARPGGAGPPQHPRRASPAGPGAIVLVLGTALLAACGAPSPAAVPTPDHGLFPDATTRELAAGLARATAMTFAAAGPHHVLGTAPDGIQLDIVGHPPSEAVLSVPAAAGRDPTGMAAPYLPALAAFVGAPPSATVTWIQGRLASWQPPATLSAATTLGGVRIELRTIEGYLRLRLTTG